MLFLGVREISLDTKIHAPWVPFLVLGNVTWTDWSVCGCRFFFTWGSSGGVGARAGPLVAPRRALQHPLSLNSNTQSQLVHWTVS